MTRPATTVVGKTVRARVQKVGAGALTRRWPASGQGDLEILSKSDALQLFAMLKQQWQQNVAAVIAAGG